ncbi:DNA translocase FtsK [Candidatus Liberibacter africanus]|uniref:Cell division protein n=1 Tax=Candidatus Liberibacter africanus PTSAPSY TaxID=1277257 RepID=A0A0G3I339_LIBAF|nr:DNA translocase FtsK [Candidatus Liberibacter africanus]AKK20301.1 cell division protein [Candidatus Liberibacter africanus PTSAPSY]QTP64056.1 DNA translocase FtsK [Candidatus Liberibacter africanus]
MKFSKNNKSHWLDTIQQQADLKSFLPPWHEAFLLSPNVRFTRTPEKDLTRYRNSAASQRSNKTDSIGDYLHARSNTESLRFTSSLAHLKSQFMMNRNLLSDPLHSQKTPYKLHVVQQNGSCSEQDLQKENIKSSSEDVKTEKPASDIPNTINQNPDTLSWLSDCAFFEGLSMPHSLVSFNDNSKNEYYPVKSTNDLQIDLVPHVLKKKECSDNPKVKSNHTLKKTEPSIDSVYQRPTYCKKTTGNMFQNIITETSHDPGQYDRPCSSFLQTKSNMHLQKITHESLEKNAGLLETILEEFGIKGEMIDVKPGPVVTLYEFEPAPGIKSSRIIGLADDIARSMSSLSARVAVIPKRNAIGIELPNDIREIVYLRQIIESQPFLHSKANLALCLGKTIGGESVIADLANMPHILVAGTTGSGKSVAINTMIVSLLYRLSPDQCRMIMVDPKMLELSVYDGIPHLLTPVVTDPKKAVMALKWAVREMEERYRKMSRISVRNIKNYNERVASMNVNESDEDLRPMPYIVIVVDEMADLMMVAGKEIEGAIQRLAQMARAAGIHLIMATQRPSVDVITGTIKANFPIRISFQVTSKIDSRTILGEHGAEQLLGQGDMLYMSGGGRIQRVHGPLVSEIEIEKIVQHLKKQGLPEYLNAVTSDADKDENNLNPEGTKERSDLYAKAVDLVMENQRCSTSFIQRRLQIGYNRAALLVERMEQEGLVSEADHVGKRHIFSEKFSSS